MGKEMLRMAGALVMKMLCVRSRERERKEAGLR